MISTILPPKWSLFLSFYPLKWTIILLFLLHFHIHYRQFPQCLHDNFTKMIRFQLLERQHDAVPHNHLISHKHILTYKSNFKPTNQQAPFPNPSNQIAPRIDSRGSLSLPRIVCSNVGESEPSTRDHVPMWPRQPTMLLMMHAWALMSEPSRTIVSRRRVPAAMVTSWPIVTLGPI